MLERYKEIIGKAHDTKKSTRALGLIGAIRHDKNLEDHEKLDRIFTVLDARSYYEREKVLRHSAEGTEGEDTANNRPTLATHGYTEEPRNNSDRYSNW